MQTQNDLFIAIYSRGGLVPAQAGNTLSPSYCLTNSARKDIVLGENFDSNPNSSNTQVTLRIVTIVKTND